jgi:uncharacterized phiE125 gp8 family phage protein
MTQTEAKAFLRVDHTADDGLITKMIDEATALVENFLGFDLVDYTWTQTENGPSVAQFKNAWGASTFLTLDQIKLRKRPVQSILEVYTTDKNDVETLMDPSNYYLLQDEQNFYLKLQSSASWPIDLRAYDSIKISYQAGSSDLSQINPAILSAVQIILMHLYENRGDSETDLKIPPKAYAQLSPFKTFG